MTDFDYITSYGDLLTEDEAREQFDDMLNDFHGNVVIGDMSWTAADVVKEMDPIGYDVMFSNYTSGESIQEYYEGHEWEIGEDDDSE